MKMMIDSRCERCGATFSTFGLDVETVREIAASHVCVDGVATASGEPTTRLVAGPGERLTDLEVAS